MNIDNSIDNQGLLDVGSGHKIYWEDWGNPSATPIFHLHGGPGGSFSESHKQLYDPLIHRVIFHDQRGCGQSVPFAEVAHNTTNDLIADIEALRAHLNIEQMHVSGGSWGSTLALLYAISHPQRVISLMLWSIFLARQSELDYVNEGSARHTFPEAWERFIELVPVELRKNGNEIMRFYHKKLQDPDPQVAKQYAEEWTLWEMTLVSMDYHKEKLEAMIANDPASLSIAKLELHYFINSCFIPENYILNTIQKIKDIPCAITQGRFDMCTPPSTALTLYRAYGDKATLKWVNSGHLRTEPEMFAALQNIALKQLR